MSERGGLPAAHVAASGLGRVERGEHAIGKVAGRRFERAAHRGPDAIVGHHVGLHRIARADVLAGRRDRRGARVRRHPTLRVDHRDLPAGALLVGLHELIECLRRAHAPAHQRQPARAVPGIDERLRGDGADAGLGPRHDGSDREPVRLHGHAHLAGGRVARDDGVGVHERVGKARSREGEAQQGSGDQSGARHAAHDSTG